MVRIARIVLRRTGGVTMQFIRFGQGRKPERLETLEKLPEQGFAWLDVVREEGTDWVGEVKRLTGTAIYEAHVIDANNEGHPSFFESTDAYEMVIFRGLASSDTETLQGRPIAFLLFPGLLVTVRARESVSIATVSKCLLERAGRAPKLAAELMLLVLHAMVDRFMAMREPLAERLEEWQDALLDPTNPFDDWMSLMRQRNRLRRLERMCDEQADAVDAWREQTGTELDPRLTVLWNDLMEHIQRVLSHVRHLEAQLESLVQIHFAAVAHRTNDIMRVLTILTAVFLPLSLVAGIFGMNFENMPELKFRYAYFVTLGVMLLLAAGMLYLFRRKRWL
jgi:magnesium/cobalt transport protein CorA